MPEFRTIVLLNPLETLEICCCCGTGITVPAGYWVFAQMAQERACLARPLCGRCAEEHAPQLVEMLDLYRRFQEYFRPAAPRKRAGPRQSVF